MAEGYRLDTDLTPPREHVEGYSFESTELASPDAQTVAANDLPSKAAHKDEWIAAAISRGVPSYEASNMTKPQLVERLGG